MDRWGRVIAIFLLISSQTLALDFNAPEPDWNNSPKKLQPPQMQIFWVNSELLLLSFLRGDPTETWANRSYEFKMSKTGSSIVRRVDLDEEYLSKLHQQTARTKVEGKSIFLQGQADEILELQEELQALDNGNVTSIEIKWFDPARVFDETRGKKFEKILTTKQGDPFQQAVAYVLDHREAIVGHAVMIGGALLAAFTVLDHRGDLTVPLGQPFWGAGFTAAGAYLLQRQLTNPYVFRPIANKYKKFRFLRRPGFLTSALPIALASGFAWTAQACASALMKIHWGP